MNRLPALGLAMLFCVPAAAQQVQRPFQGQNIELEILEMEQDADKAALKEALMSLARQGIKPAPESHKDLRAEEAALREFVDKKKVAIIARAGELRKGRVASMQGAMMRIAGAPPVDKEAAIEKVENAQVEAQLLQAEINLLQPDLTKAIEALAAAEIAASKDEAKRAEVDGARKAYEKIKAKFVEVSKQLQAEQQEVQTMQQRAGLAGMGGGFR